MTEQEQELRDIYRRLRGLQVDVTRLFRRMPWETSPGNAMGLGVGDPQLTATWTTQTTPESSCAKRIFVTCEGFDRYEILWNQAIFTSGRYAAFLGTGSAVNFKSPKQLGWPYAPFGEGACFNQQNEYVSVAEQSPFGISYRCTIYSANDSISDCRLEHNSRYGLAEANTGSTLLVGFLLYTGDVNGERKILCSLTQQDNGDGLEATAPETRFSETGGLTTSFSIGEMRTFNPIPGFNPAQTSTSLTVTRLA